MTRRLIGKRAMTPAEKQQRYRDLHNPKSRLFKQLAKKQRRAEREAELGARIWALPERRAGVLYVDPPIDWEPYSRETGMDRAAANHYLTMTFEQFSAIELPAANNCVLFMWAWRDRRLKYALQFIDDHGFEYKTLHGWKKKKVGTGYILRDNLELLLIASRGKPIWPAMGEQAHAAIEAVEPSENLFDGIIEAPNTKHSLKPEIFAEHIGRLWPSTPKLEMYYRALKDPEAERERRAKREAAGWYFYGNEVEREASASAHWRAPPPSQPGRVARGRASPRPGP